MTRERAFQLIAEALAGVILRDEEYDHGLHELPFYKCGTVEAADTLDISCDIRDGKPVWYVLRCRDLPGKFEDGTQKFRWSRVGKWRHPEPAIARMASALEGIKEMKDAAKSP